MEWSLKVFLEQAQEVASLREAKDDFSRETYLEKLEEAVHYLVLREGGVQRMYADHESEIDYIDGQIKKMQEYKKLLKSGQERIVTLVKDTYTNLKILPKASPFAPITVAKTPGKLVIDDESIIPFSYMKEVVTVEIDKVKLKEDIKAGKVVPGAHIEKDISIRGLK
jgi:hypothetical protein